MTDNEKTHKVQGELIRTIALNVVVPLTVVVTGLLVEYRSGFFQKLSDSTGSLTPNYYVLLTYLGVVVALALFTKDLILIWILQSRHIREQYDLLALLVAVLLSLIWILGTFSGVMPWTLPALLMKIIRGQVVIRSDVRMTDYVLLFLLYLLGIALIARQHSRWSGLKSLNQYNQEQRGEGSNFFSEGMVELLRILKRGQPPTIYLPIDSKRFVTQLEPVADNLTWKDQAKELIRLASSSYEFDGGWHDKERCWVGHNLDTRDLVFLYPAQRVGTEELNLFLQYTKKISRNQKLPVGEIIVALRDLTWKPVESWNGVRIRYETEATLLDRLVDFKDYFSEIKRRVTLENLPDSPLTLEQVYVPSKFVLSDGSEGKSSLEDHLNQWIDEAGQRQLALLGEYGQGKSTASLMWVYHRITTYHTPDRVPLIIELRGTSPRNLTPLALLGAWASQYNINAQALMKLLIAGRLALIFEGFDEMALVGDSEMRLKHFRTLWQFAYPKAKVLITGRPNFFLDEEEMKASLGISKPVAGRPYCEALRLAPFKPQQIREALRAYSSNLQSQIYLISKKGGKFLELVSRPSLLHIVAVLWDREQLYEKIDQLTSAYVMDLFVRHSYRRQGIKALESQDFMALTSLEREYFMSGIAAYMAHHHLPNQITNLQLNELIAHLIEFIPDSVSIDSSAISGESTQPLRERIKGTDYGSDHVKTDVRACGLLVDDPATSGTFRFGHKSFMEYLFAALLYDHIQNVEPNRTQALINATGTRIEDLLAIPEATDFLSELLRGGLASNVSNDVATAKRFFQMIFGAGIIGVIAKLGIIYEITIQSLNKTSIVQSRRFSIAFLRLFPMMITMLAFLLFFFLTVFQGVGLTYLRWVNFAMMGTMVMTFATLFSQRMIYPKLQLWHHLCTEIGIGNAAIHFVQGTRWIPWVSRQPMNLHRRLENFPN